MSLNVASVYVTIRNEGNNDRNKVCRLKKNIRSFKVVSTITLKTRFRNFNIKISNPLDQEVQSPLFF